VRGHALARESAPEGDFAIRSLPKDATGKTHARLVLSRDFVQKVLSWTFSEKARELEGSGDLARGLQRHLATQMSKAVDRLPSDGRALPLAKVVAAQILIRLAVVQQVIRHDHEGMGHCHDRTLYRAEPESEQRAPSILAWLAASAREKAADTNGQGGHGAQSYPACHAPANP
jgi:hypothetical protein